MKGYRLWWDYESGQPEWITEKAFNAIMDQRKQMNERIAKMVREDGKRSGHITIISTSDNGEGGSEDFRKLWEER